MKNIIFSLCLIVLLAPLFCLSAQESVSAPVDNLVDIFDGVSVPEKVEILSRMEKLSFDVVPSVLASSLNYLKQNSSAITSGSSESELLALTVQQIQSSGSSGFALPLWDIFRGCRERESRRLILNVLAELGSSDPEVVKALALWMGGRNNLIRMGRSIDPVIVEYAVTALVRMDVMASEDVLFSVVSLPYPEDIRQKALSGLQEGKGDFSRLIQNSLHNNSLAEKAFALDFARNDDAISLSQRQDVLHAALDVLPPGEDTSEIGGYLDFRNQLISFIQGEGQGYRPEPFLRLFGDSLQLWEKGAIKATDLIAPIKALSATETAEAADRLSLFLEVLNLYQENGRGVDERVVITVIDALGGMGDGIAYGYLLSVQHLSYSDRVKRAAWAALDRLSRS